MHEALIGHVDHPAKARDQESQRHLPCHMEFRMHPDRRQRERRHREKGHHNERGSKIKRQRISGQGRRSQRRRTLRFIQKLMAVAALNRLLQDLLRAIGTFLHHRLSARHSASIDSQVPQNSPQSKRTGSHPSPTPWSGSLKAPSPGQATSGRPHRPHICSSSDPLGEQIVLLVSKLDIPQQSIICEDRSGWRNAHGTIPPISGTMH